MRKIGKIVKIKTWFASCRLCIDRVLNGHKRFWSLPRPFISEVHDDGQHFYYSLEEIRVFDMVVGVVLKGLKPQNMGFEDALKWYSLM
jgi:hypothetical protein